MEVGGGCCCGGTLRGWPCRGIKIGSSEPRPCNSASCVSAISPDCVIATPGYYFRERQGSIFGPPHASKHILFQWHTLLPTTASARLSSYGSRNRFRSSGAG